MRISSQHFATQTDDIYNLDSRSEAIGQPVVNFASTVVCATVVVATILIPKPAQ